MNLALCTGLITFARKSKPKMQPVCNIAPIVRQRDLELLCRRTVKTFFLIHPAEGVQETRSIRKTLNGTLCKGDGFVQISIPLHGKHPGKVICGDRSVLIKFK